MERNKGIFVSELYVGSVGSILERFYFLHLFTGSLRIVSVSRRRVGELTGSF